MNFGGTPSPVSGAVAAAPGITPCSKASSGGLDATASDDHAVAEDSPAASSEADGGSDVGSPFGSILGSGSTFDSGMCSGFISSISLVIPGSVAADSPLCSGVSLAGSSATPGGDIEEVGTAAADADFGSPDAELHLQGLGSPIDESSPDRCAADSLLYSFLPGLRGSWATLCAIAAMPANAPGAGTLQLMIENTPL